MEHWGDRGPLYLIVFKTLGFKVSGDISRCFFVFLTIKVGIIILTINVNAILIKEGLQSFHYFHSLTLDEEDFTIIKTTTTVLTTLFM